MIGDETGVFRIASNQPVFGEMTALALAYEVVCLLTFRICIQPYTWPTHRAHRNHNIRMNFSKLQIPDSSVNFVIGYLNRGAEKQLYSRASALAKTGQEHNTNNNKPRQALHSLTRKYAILDSCRGKHINAPVTLAFLVDHSLVLIGPSSATVFQLIVLGSESNLCIQFRRRSLCISMHIVSVREIVLMKSASFAKEMEW